jgi:hypothetical protein
LYPWKGSLRLFSKSIIAVDVPQTLSMCEIGCISFEAFNLRCKCHEVPDFDLFTQRYADATMDNVVQAFVLIEREIFTQLDVLYFRCHILRQLFFWILKTPNRLRTSSWIVVPNPSLNVGPTPYKLQPTKP